MRITLPTATVLAALIHGHQHGFEILDVTGLRAGTVYPILRRLEENELVESRWEDPESARSKGRPARRNYRLTREGQRTAAEALDRYPGVIRMFDLPGPERASEA